MNDIKRKRQIAILGGGPSALFIYKRLVETGRSDFDVHIFERKNNIGAGMPYSNEGANKEHVTNVSDHEIPSIYSSVAEWIETAPKDLLRSFHITPQSFNEMKVLPRLFFGAYLSSQFRLLIDQAKSMGILTQLHLNCPVTDIQDHPADNKTAVIAGENQLLFDHVIVCTGHHWPKPNENTLPGYFDSPYPPEKLAFKVNHPIGIKGSSLTAIDAIKTLARSNGEYTEGPGGRSNYTLHKDSLGFKIVMHSRNGLLPGVRIHMDEPVLGSKALITQEELDQNKAENNGFLSLDFLFERNFKDQFIDKDPLFYTMIKDMDIETFVDVMMNTRKKMDPFDLFKQEYKVAEKSIKKKRSIYWREALSILSFTMNYPAKYLSAEDMQRLQKVLMPLISIVIAFVPQSSCRELMALYDADLLELLSVGDDSTIEPAPSGGATYTYQDNNGTEKTVHFKTFVDCTGQPHLPYEDFPFKSLDADGTVSPAMLQFDCPDEGQRQMEQGNKLIHKGENEQYFLKVPGIRINDSFQVVSRSNQANERIYMMAVPYIGGYNPDYSGLDFCETASETIVHELLN